jgi:hypothetical protein
MKKLFDFCKEAKSRLKTDLPPFFKKLRNSALKLGVSCGAVISANAVMSLSLNPTLITVLGYVVAGCAFIAGTAQFAQKR